MTNMTNPTAPSLLGIHDFLEWLAGCDSHDDMCAAIKAWLQANPRRRSEAEIAAHVDEFLAGWYQPPDGYDPRIVGPELDGLAEIAAHIVRESGQPGALERFEARQWVSEWAHEPHPALGGRCPVHVLHTAEGVEQVRRLLEQQQSGTYS